MTDQPKGNENRSTQTIVPECSLKVSRNSPKLKTDKGLSKSEHMNKQCHIHVMEYYSAIKKGQTTDNSNNTDEFQNHAEQKK